MVRPRSKTLFKMNGIVLEDVAVASLTYDRARSRGEYAHGDIEIAGGT